MGARGNSGVILHSYFVAFQKQLNKKQSFMEKILPMHLSQVLKLPIKRL